MIRLQVWSQQRAWSPARFAFNFLCMALVALLQAAPSLAQGAVLEAEKTYAVIVGVLEWQKPSYSSFSKENRRDQGLYDELRARGVPAQNMQLLLGKDATEARMVTALEEVAQRAPEGATLIFYYAGHGGPGSEGIYFASYDAGVAGGSREGFLVDQVSTALQEHYKGERVLLFADCCYSGGLSLVADNLSKAGFKAASLTSASIANLSSGRWTFTCSLIDALRGRALLDLDGDGQVTISEAAHDVQESMTFVERQQSGYALSGIDAAFRLSPVSPGAARVTDMPEPFKLGQHVQIKGGRRAKTARIIGYQDGRFSVEIQQYHDRRIVQLEGDDLSALQKPPLRNAAASRRKPKALAAKEAAIKATVGGKYSGLLKTVELERDYLGYTAFNDYGYSSVSSYGVEQDLPVGYWVYVYPNWYIFKEQGEAPKQRPNVLLIMLDDLGFADFGCYGSEIPTPRIDRLAEHGLRFSRFYNTAKCESSRVSLLTGLYSNEAGSGKLAHGVTLAEVLRDAGYTTLMSGKWHLSGEPTDRGFQRYFGHLSGKSNFFVGNDTWRLDGERFKDFGEDFYATTAITDHALDFMREAPEDRPLFMYVAYNAPHYPLQAPRADVERHRGKYRAGWDALRVARHARQLESGLLEKNYPLSPRPPHIPAWEELTDGERNWEDLRMATYAAMVEIADTCIGRLVDQLQEQGRLDNTLILICSDNGACPFERSHSSDIPWEKDSFVTYDAGWAHTGNTPFRLYKQNQHEGGISSPLVVHWPAGLQVEPGTITHQPGHLIDMMATLIDVGGASYPDKRGEIPVKKLQGKSLLPIFEGQQRTGHERLYFHYGNNRALLAGRWKVVSAKGGAWELYDILADRTELVDLAGKEPEILERLKSDWFTMAADTDGLKGKQLKPAKDVRISFPLNKKRHSID